MGRYMNAATPPPPPPPLTPKHQQWNLLMLHKELKLHRTQNGAPTQRAPVAPFAADDADNVRAGSGKEREETRPVAAAATAQH